MPSIYNPGDSSVTVLRWNVLPKGAKAVNRVTGDVVAELPQDVAVTPQVQDLVTRGVLQDRSVVLPVVTKPVTAVKAPKSTVQIDQTKPDTKDK